MGGCLGVGGEGVPPQLVIVATRPWWPDGRLQGYRGTWRPPIPPRIQFDHQLAALGPEYITRGPLGPDHIISGPEQRYRCVTTRLGIRLGMDRPASGR